MTDKELNELKIKLGELQREHTKVWDRLDDIDAEMATIEKLIDSEANC